jgi:hypothetical protein
MMKILNSDANRRANSRCLLMSSVNGFKNFQFTQNLVSVKCCCFLSLFRTIARETRNLNRIVDDGPTKGHLSMHTKTGRRRDEEIRTRVHFPR